MNPRYAAYLRSGGENKSYLYINWINQRWSEWASETGRCRPFNDEDHIAFDAWLQAKYPEK